MDRRSLVRPPIPDRTDPEGPAPRLDGVDPLRAAALELADRFRWELLPKFLRRLGGWKGFDASRRTDLLDDLGQELFVLALEDPEAMLEGDEAQRRRHVMRALQRSYYRLEWRSVRTEPLDIDALAIPTDGLRPELTADDLADPGLVALARTAEHRRNGRIHTSRTARRLHVSTDKLRELLIGIADALGFDDEREEFWSRRLGEALLGEAAARLLDRGLPRVWGRARRRKLEPGAAFRQVHRILRALDIRPLESWLRQHTLRFSRVSRADFARWEPTTLLHMASELLPGDARVALWRFEDAAHDGRLAAAREALQDAERWRADPVVLALARARLEELGGAPMLALHHLTCALRDHPGDPRLRSSRDALRAEHAADARRLARRYAPSTARKRSTTSRSKRA